jgi:hypothetical protein
MAKVKLDDNLYARVRKVAELAGYSSPDEFIVHVLEKELGQLEAADDDQKVIERLKGLGYLE